MDNAEHEIRTSETFHELWPVVQVSRKHVYSYIRTYYTATYIVLCKVITRI